MTGTSTAFDASLLLVRGVVGVVMIAHGLNHWMGGGRIAGTASWFEGLGLRHGRVQAWASVVTEIGCGALLIVGLATPLACAGAMAVMLVAGLLAHRRNGLFVFKDGFEYVLVLGVVSLALALLGPGEWSLDHALGAFAGGWGEGVLGAGLAVAGVGLLLGTTWRPAARGETAS